MKYNFLIFSLLILAAFIIPQLNFTSKELTVSKDSVFVIETNQGDIVVRLFPHKAPQAVENFIGLAQKEYYNNTTFHRIIPQFMIQGGDPSATGSGGKSLWGKPFNDEFDPQVNFDKPFLLAMANAGPQTNGSQFFITTVPTPWLNQKHTIFGEVIKGQDIVKKIESAGTGSGRPQSTQRIIKIYPMPSETAMTTTHSSK